MLTIQEKHCNTKLPVTIESFREIWENWNDDQKLEVIKSLIWTSADMYDFHEKVCKLINSEKFKETLD